MGKAIADRARSMERFTSAQAAVILGLAGSGRKVTSRSVDKVIQDGFVPGLFIRRESSWRLITARGLYVVAMELLFLRRALPVKDLRRKIYRTWARHNDKERQFPID